VSIESFAEVPTAKHWAILSFHEVHTAHYRFQKVASYSVLKPDQDPEEVRKRLPPDHVLLLVSDVLQGGGPAPKPPTGKRRRMSG
jgi:hypothetical protein